MEKTNDIKIELTHLKDVIDSLINEYEFEENYDSSDTLEYCNEILKHIEELNIQELNNRI